MDHLRAAPRRPPLDPGLSLYRDDYQCSMSIAHLQDRRKAAGTHAAEIFRGMILSGATVALCALGYFAYLVGR